MPIDGGLDQHLEGFSGTRVLFHFFEPELRNRELKSSSNLVSRGQEIVQEETLWALYMTSRLSGRLAALRILDRHGVPPGQCESPWKCILPGE